MSLSGEAISFEDYKNQVTGSNIDLRPTSVILAELDELFEKGENNGT